MWEFSILLQLFFKLEIVSNERKNITKGSGSWGKEKRQLTFIESLRMYRGHYFD